MSNYRYYDDQGEAHRGPYAELFERLYMELAPSPKYRDLSEGIDTAELAEQVHNGYFAQDRKGAMKDTSGKTLADDE